MKLNHRFERSLLQGPRSRAKEFGTIGRVAREMFRGFRRLHFVGPCVTVFGSARVAEGSLEYEAARSIAAGLGREGSRHGLDEYLEIKYLCLAGIQ